MLGIYGQLWALDTHFYVDLADADAQKMLGVAKRETNRDVFDAPIGALG